MASRSLTLLRHLVRSGTLVFLTYNPSGWSYVGWVRSDPFAPASLFIFVGLALGAALVHVVRQAHGSLGVTSLFMCFLLAYTACLTFVDLSQLAVSPSHSWLLLFSLTLTLAVATAWPEWRQQRGEDKSVKRWQLSRSRGYSKN